MEPGTISNGLNGRTDRRRGRGRDLAAASRTAPESREARLTADSGDRAGATGPRVLVFVCSGLIVGVEVTAAEGARRHRVEGFITPPPAARTPVRTRGRGRPSRALTDGGGRFTLTDVTPGPFSVSLRPEPDDTPVVTEWVVL